MLSHFNHDQLFVTLWTIACQAPLSMGFSRQRYWSGLPFLPLGDLLDPEIKPCLLCLLHWPVGFFFVFFFLPLAPPGMRCVVGFRV